MIRSCRSSAFTLVEMLVSLAIFSILVLVLFSMMDNASKLWRQQNYKEEDFREARAALITMSRDFGNALLSTNPAWFYLNTNSLNTNRIAFLASLPDVSQGTSVDRGDICAVGYSLEWGTNDVSGVQTNMSLYRYVCFSDPTYTSILAGTENIESIFNNPDGTNTVRELVARDVTQFAIQAYTNDSTGTPVTAASPTMLPDMVDIVMTTVNDSAAALLTSQAQWENTNSSIILQNEESFALRMRPQTP